MLIHILDTLSHVPSRYVHAPLWGTLIALLIGKQFIKQEVTSRKIFIFKNVILWSLKK